MDHKEFKALHTAMIEKIKASGVKMKWYGPLAYDMAEKECIRLTGDRMYTNYNAFMTWWHKRKGLEDVDFVPVLKKKRQPVFRRTEFDSKFNWLF